LHNQLQLAVLFLLHVFTNDMLHSLWRHCLQRLANSRLLANTKDCTETPWRCGWILKANIAPIPKEMCYRWGGHLCRHCQCDPGDDDTGTHWPTWHRYPLGLPV